MNPAVLMLLLLLQALAPAQTRPGAIAGRVLSVDNTPAANVRVSAMEVTEANGAGGTPALVGFSQTDSAGRFRIDNLPPGRYYILAGPLEFPSYYPGVADRAAATAVSVTAGAALDALNFSLSAANQNGMIQVVVQALGTSAPIANAQVTLRRQAAGAGSAIVINTTTDANGQVTIGGLLSGQYQVTVESAGFVGLGGGGPRGRGQASPTMAAPVALSAQQPESRVVFSMMVGGTIEGRVLDGNGQPVATARVSLALMGYQEGRRALLSAPSGNAQTDAQGRYRFTAGPGQYYIRIETPRTGAAAQMSLPLVAYYPGTTEIGNAKTVNLNYGDQLSAMNVTIATPRGVNIAGTVRNPLPGMISSFHLVARDPGRIDLDVPLVPNMAALTVRRSAPADLTPFEIRGVPPGDYDLYPLFGDNSSGTTSYMTARTPISVRDQNITNLSLTLRPRRILKGKFVLQGDVPAIPWENVRLQFQSTEFLPTLVRTVAAPVVDSVTREFSAALAESTFRIAIAGLPPAVYVADIRQANKSIFGAVIDTNNGDPEPVEIVLRNDSATVQGLIRNAGNQQTFVVLIPATQRQNTTLYKRATAILTGRFTISGIAPGDYVLYAFPLPTGRAEEDAEFIA